MSDTGQITDNTDASRLEVRAEGYLAELLYRKRGNRFVIVHTDVPPELEGRGLGGALVQAAVDRAAGEGLTVAPLCPFARMWLERHPDVAAKVTIDWRQPGSGGVPAGPPG
jgi:predicted GNAT family acetyltransferase